MKGNVINVYKITSKFGQLENFRNKPHTGLDFKMEIGEPIRAIREGTIRVADYENLNSGKTVFIDTENGTSIIYGHLNDFTVQSGQHVNVGDLLGHAGNTGFSTGSHLHLGLKKGGEYLDPSSLIDSIQQMNTASCTIQQAKLTFMEYFQQHMDLIGSQVIDAKVNLIHFIASTDYLPLIQLFKSVIQFIFFNF
jgi:murein DD-endopeptidase MepM/ murein hydrolase activator NlpD